MAVQIQLRRDTAAAWTAANPTLAQGEVGLETDTQLHKVGDGATAWNSLPYRGRFVALQAGSQTATNGTAVLSNANGVSFGMSGSSAITASVDAIRSVFAGTTNSVGPALSFLDANNVSFGMTSGTVTAIASFPQRPAALSAGTTQATSGTIVFSNSNGVSFGVDGQTITASFSGGGGGGIAAAAGTQTASSGTVVLANSNGISFGMSNSSQITASYTVPSTAGLISAVRVSAGTASSNLTAVEFANGSGVSFGLDAGSKVTASIAAGATATGNLGGLAAGGSTVTSGTVVMNNANGVSFGYNGQTITASVGAGATATGNFGAAAAGTQTATSGTVAWADSNGLTFGMSASTRITGSHDGVRSISAGTTRATGGEVVFSNSNGVSFGVNGQTVTASFSGGGGGGITAINLSAGTTSQNASAFVFADGGGVSFGLNGSTITAAAPSGAGATASVFDPRPDALRVTGVVGQGTLALQPVLLPLYMHHDRFVFPINFSGATNSTASVTMSMSIGFYTENNVSLSLLTSYSTSQAITHSGTANSSNNVGPRLLTMGATGTLTAGMYFVGIHSRTTTGGANASLSQYVVSQLNSSWSGLWGAASNTSVQNPLGQGIYSASFSTAMPSSINFSQIQGGSSAFQRPPLWWAVSGSA